MGGARRTLIDGPLDGMPETAPQRDPWRRLFTLVLLGALALVAGRSFLAVADRSDYQVHSDDLTWMWRFVEKPRAALPSQPTDYRAVSYLPGQGQAPQSDLDYIWGLDQPALERWVFHGLLHISGRFPETLPEKNWDYTHDLRWNVENGNVGPPDAVHFVRVVNAAFMILAVVLIFAALARAVSPLAGLIAGLYFVLHPSVTVTMWSIGPDPLLWLLMAAGLALWVWQGATWRGAVLVGVVGGLAASAKLNGALVIVGFCLWLVLKRRPLLALLAGVLALAVFVVVNPILFSRGVTGLPGMLWEMARWRSVRTGMMMQGYPAFAAAPRWYIPFYLLGAWWALVPLLVVSQRLWRFEPAVFWAATLAIGHLALVTVPEPRYTLLIEAVLVTGLIAGYWPKRLEIPAAWRRRGAPAAQSERTEADARKSV